MNEDHIVDFVASTWDEQIVPELEAYIRIPNKSPAFDPDWEKNGHMQQAAEQLLRWVRSFEVKGASAEIFTLPGRTPALLIDIAGQAKGNVLLYGHYDKQPEFTGWSDGLSPWTPVIRNNRLYGRGGADDGYAIFACLTAIAAVQKLGLPHARCFLLIEGCEESGSFDLPFYMDALAERIGTPDLVICLDAECGNYNQLWLTTSLRGMLPGTLNVEILTEGVHSGAAGGIVPSSFRLLRQILNRVEDAENGGITDLLQVEIPENVREQAKIVATELGDMVVERFPWAGKSRPHATSYEDFVLANTWAPSLGVVGLSGAPDVLNAGNTLRPNTLAKLVFRLPPTLNAERAGQALKGLLESDPPTGSKVTFELEHPQTGWHAPSLADWLVKSANNASRAFFERPMLTMGTGGTIPFMKMLGDRFSNVQFVVTGLLGPGSNAHGPNEFLEIPTGKRVTACIAAILADHANRS